MLCPLLLSLLIVTVSAHFTTISPSQSIESGGGGTVRQCSSKLTEDILKFSCVQCAESEEQCPEHCCVHVFEESAETTSVVCAMDRCCLRILSNGNGKSMFVAEALSTRSRRPNTTSCEGVEVDFECPHCAFAVSANEVIECSLGVSVPPWEQPYAGTLCVDTTSSNEPDPSANEGQTDDGKSSAEDAQRDDDAPESMLQDPGVDGEDVEPNNTPVQVQANASTTRASSTTLPTNSAKEPRESGVSKPSRENSPEDQEKTAGKDTLKDVNPDEDMEPEIEGTAMRLSTIVGIVVGTLSVLLFVFCGFVSVCCRELVSCPNLFGSVSHSFLFTSTKHVTANRVQPLPRKKALYGMNSDLTQDSSDGTRTPYDTERHGSEPGDDAIFPGHERRNHSAFSSQGGAQPMMDSRFSGDSLSAASTHHEGDGSFPSDCNSSIFV